MSSPETIGSHVDVVDVRAKLQSMAEDVRINELIALVIDLLMRVKEENNALTQRLQKALRALYGRKSEKVTEMAFLRNFRGHLQGDGYAGYEKALRDVMQSDESVVPEERRLACGMHIRRKFEEAAKLGDVRAAVAINYFKAIYKLEKEYKEHKLSADDRLVQRANRSVPLSMNFTNGFGTSSRTRFRRHRSTRQFDTQKIKKTRGAGAFPKDNSRLTTAKRSVNCVGSP